MKHPARPRSTLDRCPRRLWLRALTMLLAVCLLGLPSVSAAAPTYHRLSFTGDTATSVTIAWNTTAVTTAEVRYGTSPGSLTATKIGTSLTANAGLGYVHEATLTGLSPKTKYYYVAGGAPDGFSAEKSFTTGPAAHETCGSFKFVFLGDNRPDPTFGGGENWPTILGQSAKHDPAFVLNGGDMVIDGDRVDQWNAFLGWTEAVSATVPFMPAIGNHDNGPGEGDGANYNQLFALPRATGPHGSGTEDYYYFTYGNAIFVSLSTESFKGGAIPFAEQAAWLDEVLTNNPKKWKLVYYHKPTYTTESLFSISHPANEAGQNAAFVPVFDKHHVDVVVTSHNHWYERFEPSACGTKGQPDSKQPCSVGASNFGAGTVYLVSGGAGAFTIPAAFCGINAGRALCSGDHHYLLFQIDNEVLKVETWGAYPQANQVIDTITIAKKPEACATAPDAGPGGGPDASPPGDSGAPTASPEAPLAPDAPAAAPASSGGCGCHMGSGGFTGAPLLWAFAALLGAWGWRRKARWGLLAVTILGLGLACSAKKAAPPFSCEQLQSRVSTCERETLSFVRKGIEARLVGGATEHAGRQFDMFHARFEQRLRARQIQTQCDSFCAATTPESKTRVARMEACYAARDCDSFAQCVVGL